LLYVTGRRDLGEKMTQNNTRINTKLQRAEEKYQRNLQLFKERAPALYQQISKSARPRLSVDPESLEICRLTADGRQIYGTTPVNHAVQEVEFFQTVMSGKIYAPKPSNLDLTFLIKEKAFYATAKKYAEFIGSRPEKRSHLLPANLDLVVFGIGLGLHCEMLVNSRQFTNITIIENDVVNLIASMYVVDWNAMLAGLDDKSTITFHIHQGEGHDAQFEKSLREHFLRLYPSIGVSTLIYNHEPFAREYDKAKHIIEEYASHVKVSSEMIGPEAQRLFNANENVLRNFPAINFEKTQASHDRILAIVGAGPSLDNYAPIIKEQRDKFYLISAGSGLSSLVRMGIKPDLHFELEFQHLATSLLTHLNQEIDLKELDLICTYEAHPGFTGLFRKTYMFIPESSELQPTIGNTHTLRRGGITCTNGATAFASTVSNHDIYLIGLDFAHTGGAHHSKTNISNDETLPDNLMRLKTVSESRSANIKLKDTSGGEVFTSVGLNSARITMETLLTAIPNKVYNCSKGAHIEGTEYVSEHSLQDTISKLPDVPDSESTIAFECDSIDIESVVQRTKDVLESSLNIAEEIYQTVSTFENNAKHNAIKVREIFNSIGYKVGGDIGKYRNAMSVSKYPLYQLFVVCNFTSDDYQKELVNTWLTDYRNYLEFLKPLFFNMIENRNFVTDKDWMF